jgi:hypothetical protein
LDYAQLRVNLPDDAWSSDIEETLEPTQPTQSGLGPGCEHAHEPECVHNNPTARNRSKSSIHIQYFPDLHAGAPISDEIASPPDLEEYMHLCGPFMDLVFSETAKLMMEKEMTNSTWDRHLQSGMVSSRRDSRASDAYLNFQYEGRIPWPSSYTLLQDIDLLPSGPAWTGEKIVLQGRYKYVLCVFQCDPIKVVHELISDRHLKDKIAYAPQQHFMSIECLVRIFSEMWTGDWWWDAQVSKRSNRDKS